MHFSWRENFSCIHAQFFVFFYVQSMQNHLVPAWWSWIFWGASTFYCTINQRLHGNIHLMYSKHNFTYRCACCSHMGFQEAVSTCRRTLLFGNAYKTLFNSVYHQLFVNGKEPFRHDITYVIFMKDSRMNTKR